MNDQTLNHLITIVNTIESINKEFLLITRIIYKVKNQFRRQKQFQILQKLKRMLDRGLLVSFKDYKNSTIKGNNLYNICKSEFYFREYMQ